MSGNKKGKKVVVTEEEDDQKQITTTMTTAAASCSRSASSSSTSSSDGREYEVQDLHERLRSSRGSRFDLIEKELGLRTWRKFSSQALLNEIRGFSRDFVIHPDNR